MNNTQKSEYRVELCEDSQRWDAFVTERSRLIYFQWRWREIVESTFGHPHHYLQAVDANGTIAAVLPLVELRSRMFGHYALSLPFVNYGGILGENAAARDALIARCDVIGSQLGLSHIQLREDGESACDWECEQHKVTMLLQLPAEEEILWKQIGSKRRAQIKRPAREGAGVKVGHLELLSDFYLVFSENMRDLGTPVYSKKWFANILAGLGQEARLVLIYLAEKPVAAAFLIRHGPRMEIPWASSLREANRFGVNMLLYWEVLKFSIGEGCEQFDFGRSSKEASTYRFKKQWGSEPHQLYWYHWTPQGREMPRLDPGNRKYATAISLWQRLPLPVANLLGPGIVKYLP